MNGANLASAIVLAASVIGSRGATPQDAVSSFLSVGTPQYTVTHITQHGGYALVKTSGGRIEGESLEWPLLVQRYDFGWQIVGWVREPCDLTARGVDSTGIAALSSGMHLPSNTAADCKYPVTRVDGGPAGDVASVRAIATGPVITYAFVRGNYAIAEWIGAGGGQEIFAKTDGRWHMLAHSGGAYAPSDIVNAGVPRNDACALFQYASQTKDCPH